MLVNIGIYRFWVLLLCVSILFSLSMGFTPYKAKQLLLGMDLQGERKRRET